MNCIIQPPVFALPDFEKTFQIENDASDTAIGDVFTQDHASVHKLIAFLSKNLTNSKKITVFITISCLQLSLVAKLAALTLIGNKL